MNKVNKLLMDLQRKKEKGEIRGERGRQENKLNLEAKPNRLKAKVTTPSNLRQVLNSTRQIRAR